MQKKNGLARIEEYLLISLEEIRKERRLGYDCEFAQGKTYAYVECLEFIWNDMGMDYDIMLALEARHGIRK